VPISPDRLLRSFPDLRPRNRSLPRISIRPFVFKLRRKPRIRTNEESDYHFWVSLEELLRSKGSRVLRIRGRDRRVPAFLIGKYVIWGITYRILKRFLDAY